MKKKTAIVVCPGRGTYNKTELGYLKKNHSDESSIKFIKKIDEYRKERARKSILELDYSEKFVSKEFLLGENSASLIYACAYLDFLKINKEKFDIVGITGNSMGWYLALACANALNEENATHLIETMGAQMRSGLIGGQLIYPEVDSNWKEDIKLKSLIDNKIIELTNKGHKIFNSIRFGGYRILGGEDKALKILMDELPKVDDKYPFILQGNAAFHTPLLTSTSQKAKEELNPSLFSKPKIPLIDGKGNIWEKYSTDTYKLWDYTLGDQVDSTYDFSKALEVSLKEFNPDYFIILGPGMTLGGATAQALINTQLTALKDKNSFKKIQETNPILLSMGDESQRKLVL